MKNAPSTSLEVSFSEVTEGVEKPNTVTFSLFADGSDSDHAYKDQRAKMIPQTWFESIYNLAIEQQLHIIHFPNTLRLLLLCLHDTEQYLAQLPHNFPLEEIVSEVCFSPSDAVSTAESPIPPLRLTVATPSEKEEKKALRLTVLLDAKGKPSVSDKHFSKFK